MSGAVAGPEKKKARLTGLRLPVRFASGTLLCEPVLRPGDKVLHLYRAAEAAANKPLRLLTRTGAYLKAEITATVRMCASSWVRLPRRSARINP